jgi:hypothetical protein
MTIVGNDWVNGYWFGVTPAGKLRFYPHGGSYYDSPGSIAAGQWSHVAVSYDARSNMLAFYINGVKSSTTTIQGYIGASTTDFRIGADRSGTAPDYYWSGAIDEVRVWNEALDFSTALGMLYRIPHAVVNGLYGRYLVAGWRLNGNETEITGQLDGTASGTLAYITTPLPPHYPRICAVFVNRQNLTSIGSTDYFAIPSSTLLSMQDNFTLECWVQPASAYGSATYQTFFSKGANGSTAPTYWLGLDKATGKVRFAPNGTMATALLSDAAIPAGQWTHVAARYALINGARTATIFINGLPAGTRVFANPGNANALPLLIGIGDLQTIGDNAYGFAGKLDEARVWNTARSDDEIADNYRAELTGPNTGLSAVYHFDGDILDHSGNGQDGSKWLHNTSDQYFCDASDLPAQPSLTLTTPNGGESWQIGTSHAIKWAATGLVNVRIEVSRDGGATWEIIAASTAASWGSFTWPVTGPATTNARVRVGTPSATAFSDESAGDFTIFEPPPFLEIAPGSIAFTAAQNGPLPAAQLLHLRNTGGGTMNWNISPGTNPDIGVSPEFGFGNDDSTAVSLLTTALAPNLYTATLTITGNASNMPMTVNVQYRITPSQYYSITGKVTCNSQPLSGIDVGIDGSASFTVATGNDGRYTLGGLGYGDYTVTPSSIFYDFTPPSRSYTGLASSQTDANFAASPKSGTMRIRYKEGWNLISLPLVPVNPDMHFIFPDAVGKAFIYKQDSGYVMREELQYGTGYWIKFQRTDSVLIAGVLQALLVSNMSEANGGWNLAGVPSGPVPVSSIVQVPAGAIVSIYEYDPVLGYFPPTSGALRPGKAYFVKVDADATITMSVSSLFRFPEPWQSLRAWPSGEIVQPPAPPR